jgi:hypothetical protein
VAEHAVLSVDIILLPSLNNPARRGGLAYAQHASAIFRPSCFAKEAKRLLELVVSSLCVLNDHLALEEI